MHHRTHIRNARTARAIARTAPVVPAWVLPLSSLLLLLALRLIGPWAA